MTLQDKCQHKYHYMVYETGTSVNEYWRKICNRCGKTLMTSDWWKDYLTPLSKDV